MQLRPQAREQAVECFLAYRLGRYCAPGRVIHTVATLRISEHTVISDDTRPELLWLFKAPLLTAALERGKGTEARNDLRGVVDQVAERAVAQLEHQVSNAVGRFRVQFAENVLDEALIFLDFFRFDQVADEPSRHVMNLSACSTRCL